MWASNSFVFFSFRVINFAVLIGISFYLYKKYFKSSIEEKITQKEALLKGLEEQGYFLEGRAHDLEKQRKAQEMKASILKQKIEEWNIHVVSEKYKRHEEYKIHMAQAADRIAIKNNHLVQHYWRMKVIPEVLKDARSALAQKFAQPSHNNAFVHDIVQHLERK